MGLHIVEGSPFWQFVSERNRGRQFDFIHTSAIIANAGAGLEIDHEFICSLNLYATHFISPQPGRYRRHYNVTVQAHAPSDWSVVFEEMENFLLVLHQEWVSWDPIQAAAYALWGVNHVHPFCDGNGRTSRALCYFVLCRKLNDWPRGSITIMELIRTREHGHYCEILQRMHDARTPDMHTNIEEMTSFLNGLLLEQIRS